MPKINSWEIRKIIILFSLMGLVGYVVYMNYENGDMTVLYSKPVEEKYLYRVDETKVEKVRCFSTRSTAKDYVKVLLNKNMRDSIYNNSDYYDKETFFFHSIERKINVYKYFDANGVEFALISFPSGTSSAKFSNTGVAFVPRVFLHDTLPVVLKGNN